MVRFRRALIYRQASRRPPELHFRKFGISPDQPGTRRCSTPYQAVKVPHTSPKS
jgi:hypothetical protein